MLTDMFLLVDLGTNSVRFGFAGSTESWFKLGPLRGPQSGAAGQRMNIHEMGNY